MMDTSYIRDLKSYDFMLFAEFCCGFSGLRKLHNITQNLWPIILLQAI